MRLAAERRVNSHRSRFARSSPWPAKTPRTAIYPSANGARARWPGKRSSAALSPAFRTARWDAFLKESALKPHRIRYWLTPKPDPDFEAKSAGVCAAYLEAPAAAEKGVRTVSIDEMAGIQALERAAPSLPMKPGKVERREFEYIRHGTQTLIAAFDVATGKVQGAVGATRTEGDYVAFLEALFATDEPAAQWKIVCDNLNTHLSEGVVRLVARLSGVNEELGEKAQIRPS